jgi:hypothetical protein
MANQFVTSDIIANMALAQFQNNNTFVMTANRGYETDFPLANYKQHDVINIRERNFASFVDGRISSPYDASEKTVSLVVDHQYNASFEVTAKDLTLDIETNNEYWKERYIVPNVEVITKGIDSQLSKDAINQLYFTVGTPGTPLNSFAAIDAANVKLSKHAVDIRDRYFALSLEDASALKSSQQVNFNDTLNNDISFYSRLGRFARFELFENQSITTHTTGSQAGTILVNGAVSSGNTIVMDGATPSETGIFRKGDTVSFAGVNSVNPIDKSDTGDLAQFVVLADADSDGAGNVTITVNPAIDSDIASVRRNVTNAIPDNAAVSIYGVTTPGTPVTYNVNVAYVKRALDLVVPPLAHIDINRQYTARDTEKNLALRVGIDGDIRNDQNMMRFDVLWGALWHGAYAVKVIS